MRNLRKQKKQPRIDKSELAFPIRPRLRLKHYRKSFRHRSCVSCGTDKTVVPAHIRHGLAGGVALKPDDTLCMPLCGTCHTMQHKNEVLFWLMAMKWDIVRVKREALQLYLDWEKSEAPLLTGRKIESL